MMPIEVVIAMRLSGIRRRVRRVRAAVERDGPRLPPERRREKGGPVRSDPPLSHSAPRLRPRRAAGVHAVPVDDVRMLAATQAEETGEAEQPEPAPVRPVIIVVRLR